MPEKVVPGPVQEDAVIREAVCVHTKKIFDSCREEDIASYKKRKSLYYQWIPSIWFEVDLQEKVCGLGFFRF